MKLLAFSIFFCASAMATSLAAKKSTEYIYLTAQGNSGTCYEMPSCEGNPLGVMNAPSCSNVGRSWLDDSDGTCTNF